MLAVQLRCNVHVKRFGLLYKIDRGIPNLVLVYVAYGSSFPLPR
jgi:hypothetical protein